MAYLKNADRSVVVLSELRKSRYEITTNGQRHEAILYVGAPYKGSGIR